MPLVRDLHAKARRTLVMGILNATPDSFYSESRVGARDAALEQAATMVEQGADILDIGGESTRPGAAPVEAQEEQARVLPIIQALQDTWDVPISIDTRRASTAEAALQAGASVVNDVSAGQDPRMFEVVADHGADLVLMHMQGEPATMQEDPTYGDVVAEVQAALLDRAQAAQDAGVARENIVLDPGIGFGKTLSHNLALIGATEQLVATGFPVLFGVSRKSMFDHLLGRPVEERLAGSLAVAAHAAREGAAVVRVHDVAPTRDVIDTIKAIQEARA